MWPTPHFLKVNTQIEFDHDHNAAEENQIEKRFFIGLNNNNQINKVAPYNFHFYFVKRELITLD